LFDFAGPRVEEGEISMKPFLGKLGVVFVALLGIVVSADAWGENWKALKSDDSGSSYYDLDSRALISQGVIRVWEQYVYTVESVTRKMMKYGSKYESLKNSMTLWEINCAEKKARIISTADYSHDGKVISKTKEGAEPWPWGSYAPESLGGRLIQAICGPP
jgi:hypothetical protein